MRRHVVLALLLLAGPALAEPRVLRLATVAPDGSAWARELKAFARDVDAGTDGRVKVKFYFGSIAGDEPEVAARIRRGQLDGAASGGLMCADLAPSLRVVMYLGLFQNRDETTFVVQQLKPILDAEYQKNGFTNLGEASVGPVVLFSRDPIDSMAALRREKLWIWTIDDKQRLLFDAIGAHTVRLPLTEAGRAYAEGKIDAFASTPTATLAFQWSSQVRWATELKVGFITGCLLVANRAFDPLSVDDKQAVRAAAAKLGVRFDDVGRAQDQALLGGLLARQGVKIIQPSTAFRDDFFDEMRQARVKLKNRAVPEALLERVLGMLADYRAERAPRRD